MDRKLQITRALLGNERGTYASIEVLVEAKRLSVPEIVTRARHAIRERNYSLACSLALDMLVDKGREIRVARGMNQELRKAAMESGDTGGVVELEVQWDAKICVEGEEAIASKCRMMIRDALYAMYEDSEGAMGHSEWKNKAKEMREMLVRGIAENIVGAEFLPLTKEEACLIGNVWEEGMEMASEAVREGERHRAAPWRANT